MNEKHGHPDFYKYLEAMATLHSDKNAEYTQGGDPLGNFHRVSAILKIWGYDIPPWLVAAIYALKQQDCSMIMLRHGAEGKIESIDNRVQDEGIYAVLKRVLIKEEKEGGQHGV
jgi:hypothetical protein